MRQLQVTNADGSVANTTWRQGLFNSTFNRTCPGDASKQLDLRWWLTNGSYVNATYANGSFVGGSILNATVVNGSVVRGTAYFARHASLPVDDTAWAFAPRIDYTDARVVSEGRWYEAGGECVDEVILGCFNNAICVAPNTCSCASGWEGNDCTLPQCAQSVDQMLDSNLTDAQLAAFPATLLRANGGANVGTPASAAPPLPGDLNVAWRKCRNNGNCTLPGVCTCEKGWAGDDCSIPQCIQECFHGGVCTGPDTCTCVQVPTTFQDARGQPLFVKPNGVAQDTGYTGFDCNTPICVQAATWVPNDATYSGGTVVLLSDTGKPLWNDGAVFQAGCSDDSIFISSLPVTRKSTTLCRVAKWYLGNYLEPWSNDDVQLAPPPTDGSGNPASYTTRTTSMFSLGRTARVNFPNYIKTVNASTGLVVVTQGPEIAGEGLYACYQGGACVSPDLCQCMQGWGGYDCNTPQCIYTDFYLNTIEVSGKITHHNRHVHNRPGRSLYPFAPPHSPLPAPPLGRAARTVACARP